MDPQINENQENLIEENKQILNDLEINKKPETNENILFCENCLIIQCENTEHKKKSTKDLLNEYKTNLNSAIDYSILDRYLTNINNSDLSLLLSKLNEIKTKSNNLLKRKLDEFQEKIANKINKLNQKIDKKFDILENNFIEAENRIQSNNIEVINNITVEEIIAFFDTNKKSQKDLENMINLVKKNSDQDKIKKNLTDIETILYSKMISSGQNFDFVDIKLDEYFKELLTNCSDFSRDLEIEIETPSIYRINKNKFSSNPLNLKFRKDITDKLQKSYTIDSVFCVFTTFDGRSFVAWGCPTFTIEIYDLIQDKIIKSLTGFTAHIYITRHFSDKISKKDYLLTTSFSRCCKIWDCSDFSNIVTLQNCHTASYLYSGLIIFDPLFTESPLVLTVAPNENIKIWDFNNNLVNSINATQDYTYFLNIWYDERNNKNNIYIVNANSKDVKIFDYRSGKIFKTFQTQEHGTAWHMSAFVENLNNKPYLFESDGNGYLRIWDIDEVTVYKKVCIKGCNLRGICFWNDNYVLAAGTDKCVKVINIENENLEGQIDGHNNILCTIEKIHHPIFGESILTGAIDGKIKLYSFIGDGK